MFQATQSGEGNAIGGVSRTTSDREHETTLISNEWGDSMGPDTAVKGGGFLVPSFIPPLDDNSAPTVQVWRE